MREILMLRLRDAVAEKEWITAQANMETRRGGWTCDWTIDQLRAVLKDVETGRDSMGMAFYEPPARDRISVIEAEGVAKLKRLQAEFDAYRGNAETAIETSPSPECRRTSDD